jgi:hypothetical protein
LHKFPPSAALKLMHPLLELPNIQFTISSCWVT